MRIIVLAALVAGCMTHAERCPVTDHGAIDGGTGSLNGTLSANRFAMDVSSGSWAPDADNPYAYSSDLGGGWHWVAGDSAQFFFDFDGAATLSCHDTTKAALVAATQPTPLEAVCPTMLLFGMPFAPTNISITVASNLDRDGAGTLSVTLDANTDLVALDSSILAHLEAVGLRGTATFVDGDCPAKP